MAKKTTTKKRKPLERCDYALRLVGTDGYGKHDWFTGEEGAESGTFARAKTYPEKFKGHNPRYEWIDTRTRPLSRKTKAHTKRNR